MGSKEGKAEGATEGIALNVGLALLDDLPFPLLDLLDLLEDDSLRKEKLLDDDSLYLLDDFLPPFRFMPFFFLPLPFPPVGSALGMVLGAWLDVGAADGS